MENLINRLKESDLKFIAKQTGIPYDRMYKWITGKAKPKTDDYSTLLKYFNDLDGNNSNKASVPSLEAIPLRLTDPYGFEATGAKHYTLPDGSEMMEIKVIPHKAWGSYLRGHADPEYYAGFDTVTIPVDQQHRGTYLAFEMKGESMVNIENQEMARKSLWPGQKIIGRDLKREQWQYKLHIHSNEAWIIVHREKGIVVKEITEHDVDTGRILLHSWNPDKKEYPDYEVYLDDVQQLFNIVDPFGKMRSY